MCGRFSQTSSAESLARAVGLDPSYFQNKISKRYNIAPGQPLPTLLEAPSKKVQFDYLTWGLIPSWSRGDAKTGGVINARSETVFEKPSFKGPIQNSRCLIFADGFYEWKTQASKMKQPYYFFKKNKEPFTFAGIYSDWISPDGSEVKSVAILTRQAGPLIRPIHNRMPMIIAPQNRLKWISTKMFAREEIRACMLSEPEFSEWNLYPVSTRVNNPGMDDEQCLAPLQEVSGLWN